MKTQIYQLVRQSLKAPAVYQSEHEPFLCGNIAKRGVIGTISRKAISPLAKSTVQCCKSGIILKFLSSDFFSSVFRQAPDISSGPGKVPSFLQRAGRLYDWEAFLFPPVNYFCCR